jgi:diketogulonate reductase-like aldo/keto reductase
METAETGMRTITLPGGESVPVLGIGTWNMGERRQKRADEIAALRLAVELGMTVIDTAEMYGSGAAEALNAEALGHERDRIFIVSKVMPQHASTRGTIAACEASLKRLNTDRLDLYLLHWRGGVPLENTLAAFNTLERAGKIRHWGVSNFDIDDMTELESKSSRVSSPVATNQVLYNLTRRGIELDLLPWCKNRGIPLMAYSPLEQGRLASHTTLRAIADRLNATPLQIALAWVLHQPGVMTIPKTGHVDHVRTNRQALDIRLSAEQLATLDAAFPRPARKIPLEML